jgi:filamentous hemagglutinin family protein
MAIYLRWGLGLGLAGVLVWSEANFLGSPTLAQITPDATLGAENSVVTPNVNVRGFPADRIEGGAVRGANLFHSFQEFNVENGQRVYFANPTEIENILSRVTGNNLSNILGTLGVDGEANLFLLNPNGIIFGSNAKLDISGSFVASTANSVVFNNGYQFSARNPEAPPLLTINVPLGVQYGSNQVRTTITNTGNLAVGQNLTLDAGNLDLQGQLQAVKDLTLQAQDTVKVRDSVTNPFIAVAGGKLLIQGNQLVDIFALNHPNSGLYSGGEMVLRSPDAVMGDAHYWSGGNFRIEKLDGSLGNLESPNDPIIRASGDVNLNTYQGTSLHILAGGSVTINSVIITDADQTGNAIVEDVTLSNGTPLNIRGTTQPTLDVRAGTTVFGNPGITGTNYITLFPLPNTNAPATGANITINEINLNQGDGLVFLTNQYQPNTLPGNIQVRRIRTGADGPIQFPGNGGSVVMDSRGDIIIPERNLLGISTIRTDSLNGNSGDITLIAQGSFFMRGGAQMGALSVGSGNAANINIIAGNAVSLTGDSLLSTNVQSAIGGTAGNISIRARSLSIDGFTGVAASSEGGGNAGNIFVQVDDFVSLTNGAVISSSVLEGGRGNGGIIRINAPGSVTISGVNAARGRSSALLANTRRGASGQAGSIFVNTGNFRVENGAIVDISTSNASNGGSLTINANNLDLTSGGQILAVTRRSGKAGGVNLNIADTVNISGSDPTVLQRFIQFGPDVVTNEADASGIYAGGTIFGRIFGTTGNGGNLSINARQLNVSNKGTVNTNVYGTGRAGDLAIATTDSVNVSSAGSITASSTQGDSGNLSIRTGQLNVSDELTVLATVSGGGKAGDLLIVATDSVNVLNQARISTSSSGTGVAGALDIETGKLSIRDGSLVVTSPFGSGAGGDLTVRATESIEVINGSGLSTSTNGSGDAGNVIIETQNLLVDSNSKLSADTFSSGQGGDMTINTRTLSVRNGGEVSTGVFENSSGNGGKLSVNATDSVDLNSGSLVTLTAGSGAAGNMDINTRKLTAQNGGRIEARTASLSPGGTVTVNASESIELSGKYGSVTKQGTAISAFSDNLSFGNAPSGNIILNTGELIIRDGAQITTQTLGRGKGGDVRVQANSLFLTNEGNITSRSDGGVNAGDAGNIFVNLNDKLQSSGGIISATSARAGGGDINITANDIRLRNSSLISTSVKESTGGGGNIAINSTVFLAIEDSDILANADAGPGGDIFLNSDAFLADIFSRGLAEPVGRNPGDFARFRGNNRVDISADSRTGTSGTVSYTYIDPTRRVAPLPSDFADAEGLIDRRCTPTDKKRASSFTITGRGGLPPSPNDPLIYQDELVDWVTLEDREETPSSEVPNTNSTPSNPQQLVEAQGWVIGADGKVILTASASTVTPGNSGLGYPSCEENEATTD